MLNLQAARLMLYLKHLGGIQPPPKWQIETCTSGASLKNDNWWHHSSPLNSLKTVSAKFCHRSFLARQQKKTYDGKILPSLHGKILPSLHKASTANQTILQVSYIRNNAKFVCLSSGLSMPKDNMFFAAILILRRWRNYGKRESIWSLCYQVMKEEALGVIINFLKHFLQLVYK